MCVGEFLLELLLQLVALVLELPRACEGQLLVASIAQGAISSFDSHRLHLTMLQLATL
jgi:hypothetical protein